MAVDQSEIKVLHIEDQEAARQMLRFAIPDAIEIFTADRKEKIEDILSENAITHVLLDYSLGGKDVPTGKEIYEELLARLDLEVMGFSSESEKFEGVLPSVMNKVNYDIKKIYQFLGISK